MALTQLLGFLGFKPPLCLAVMEMAYLSLMTTQRVDLEARLFCQMKTFYIKNLQGSSRAAAAHVMQLFLQPVQC